MTTTTDEAVDAASSSLSRSGTLTMSFAPYAGRRSTSHQYSCTCSAEATAGPYEDCTTSTPPGGW